MLTDSGIDISDYKALLDPDTQNSAVYPVEDTAAVHRPWLYNTPEVRRVLQLCGPNITRVETYEEGKTALPTANSVLGLISGEGDDAILERRLYVKSYPFDKARDVLPTGIKQEISNGMFWYGAKLQSDRVHRLVIQNSHSARLLMDFTGTESLAHYFIALGDSSEARPFKSRVIHEAVERMSIFTTLGTQRFNELPFQSRPVTSIARNGKYFEERNARHVDNLADNLSVLFPEDDESGISSRRTKLRRAYSCVAQDLAYLLGSRKPKDLTYGHQDAFAHNMMIGKQGVSFVDSGKSGMGRWEMDLTKFLQGPVLNLTPTEILSVHEYTFGMIREETNLLGLGLELDMECSLAVFAHAFVQEAVATLSKRVDDLSTDQYRDTVEAGSQVKFKGGDIQDRFPTTMETPRSIGLTVYSLDRLIGHTAEVTPKFLQELMSAHPELDVPYNAFGNLLEPLRPR